MKHAPLALLALALVAPQAHAAPPARQCFFIRDIENYSVTDDEKTLYLRVNGTRFYRLDLASPCNGLSFREHIAIKSWGGLSSVCEATDIDLRVREAPTGPASRCEATGLHPMTPEEVAGLPRKLKP